MLDAGASRLSPRREYRVAPVSALRTTRPAWPPASSGLASRESRSVPRTDALAEPALAAAGSASRTAATQPIAMLRAEVLTMPMTAHHTVKLQTGTEVTAFLSDQPDRRCARPPRPKSQCG